MPCQALVAQGAAGEPERERLARREWLACHSDSFRVHSAQSAKSPQEGQELPTISNGSKARLRWSERHCQHGSTSASHAGESRLDSEWWSQRVTPSCSRSADAVTRPDAGTSAASEVDGGRPGGRPVGLGVRRQVADRSASAAWASTGSQGGGDPAWSSSCSRTRPRRGSASARWASRQRTHAVEPGTTNGPEPGPVGEQRHSEVGQVLAHQQVEPGAGGLAQGDDQRHPRRFLGGDLWRPASAR